MLRKGTLHAREGEALADGSYRAVTLFNSPPHGVMVWAGRIGLRARDKTADEIELEDYLAAEKVSFCQWQDVWEYFADREYANLIAQLRGEVDQIYPGE